MGVCLLCVRLLQRHVFSFVALPSVDPTGGGWFIEWDKNDKKCCEDLRWRWKKLSVNKAKTRSCRIEIAIESEMKSHDPQACLKKSLKVTETTSKLWRNIKQVNKRIKCQAPSKGWATNYLSAFSPKPVSSTFSKRNTMEQELSIWVFILVEPQSTTAQDTRAYTHTQGNKWIHNMCLNTEFKIEKFPYCAKTQEDCWASCLTHKQNEHTESHAMVAERVVDSTVRVLLPNLFTSMTLAPPAEPTFLFPLRFARATAS